MMNYVIGDVQGLYTPLCRLLETIQFNEGVDQLWFVGDLVNRGPDSLKVLRLLKSLSKPPLITLGNHDLHLIACIFNPEQIRHAKDTLHPILNAPDAELLGHWLRHQPLLHHDPQLNVVMSHAGIYPLWSIEDAFSQAKQFESALQSDHFKVLLQTLYGNQPCQWQPNLSFYDKLRFIANAFTRMRYCEPSGALLFDYKGPLSAQYTQGIPWFLHPQRIPIAQSIMFGHWASLKGECPVKNIYALDTGCIWGGPLTALRIEDKQRFSILSE